jgi:hypothetical protein
MALLECTASLPPFRMTALADFTDSAAICTCCTQQSRTAARRNRVACAGCTARQSSGAARTAASGLASKMTHNTPMGHVTRNRSRPSSSRVASVTWPTGSSSAITLSMFASSALYLSPARSRRCSPAAPTHTAATPCTRRGPHTLKSVSLMPSRVESCLSRSFAAMTSASLAASSSFIFARALLRASPEVACSAMAAALARLAARRTHHAVTVNHTTASTTTTTTCSNAGTNFATVRRSQPSAAMPK